MKRWIILPYDRSPLARAVLRYAADLCGNPPAEAPYAGVLIATTGVDPAALGELVQEAAQIAGPDVPLEMRLLDAGDPIGSLQRLAATQPDAVFVAPLSPHVVTGHAPWYAAACREGGINHTLMLVNITQKDIQRLQEESHGGHRVGGPVARLLRVGAGLHLGKRTPVTGGTA
jgi:hypothetical protein